MNANTSTMYQEAHAAPPPSYNDTVGRMPLHSMQVTSLATSSSSSRDAKQYHDFCEKEQRRREQEFSSSTRAFNTSVASPSSPPVSLPLPAQSALSHFGNPFASSPTWAPTAHDARLTHLPGIDLETRLKMRFSGPSAEQRALAPPPNFNRLPNLPPLPAFEPIFIASAGKKEAKKQLLSDGFQPVYPGRLLTSHDVSAADWGRMLEDLTVAGRLTGKQSIISNVAPMTMHMGATGYFVTKAIEKRMKRRKDPQICEVLEGWQAQFFQARQLDVYISYNGERLTARSPNSPIPGSGETSTTQLQRISTASSSSFSSSSSSSDDDDLPGDRSARKLSKQQRKQERKERKAERKLRKKERKHDRKMDNIERKHERARRKYGDLPNRAAPLRVGGTVRRLGYFLVIAPLTDSSSTSKSEADAAAFMW